MTDKKKENTREPTALEKALAQTETITAQIIMRATEAEERINILREIQKCVDSSANHDWEVVDVKKKMVHPTHGASRKSLFEIEKVHLRCANCMCAMFLGGGDNRIYVELIEEGLDVPLEEYLIHPDKRGTDALDKSIVDEQGDLAVGKDSEDGEWFCNHCGESFGDDIVGKMLAHECYKKHHASREGEE